MVTDIQHGKEAKNAFTTSRNNGFNEISSGTPILGLKDFNALEVHLFFVIFMQFKKKRFYQSFKTFSQFKNIHIHSAYFFN